jgi:S1-C subfamily serine protease
MSYFDGNSGGQFNPFVTEPPPVKAKPNQLTWLSLALSGVSALMSVMLFIFFVIPALNVSANKEAGDDLYSAPRDLAAVVEKARAATVTVYCGDWSGSGWGIDLDDNPDSSEDDAYPFEIVTNYHVIEECVDGGEITIRLPGAAEAVPAFLYNYDYTYSEATGSTDLAILMTAASVPTLETTDIAPMPGDWLMAVGNPNSSAFDDMEGHVTFGRVSNFKLQYNVVVTDTALNHGNSGGPLVNSRGEVIGTNTWVDISEQAENIAYAIAIPKLCETLLACAPGDRMLWGQ